MKEEGTHRYDDIIHLPPPRSKVHPRMTLRERAAQFAPFAALTGYEAAIQETQRLTKQEAQLEEDELKMLDEKLQLVYGRIGSGQKVTFTCFVPDEKKEGGSYITYSGRIKKINLYERTISLEEGTVFPIARIVDIQADFPESATDS